MTWFKHTTRHTDWQKRLNEVFTLYENTDFEWGRTDCFCFASDCVKAMVGTGPMDGFKGLYTDETQATSLLQIGATAHDNNFYRVNGVLGFWSKYLGEPKKKGGVMVGDIVVCHIPRHDLVTGVVNDTGRYIYLNSYGKNLLEVPIGRAKYVWGV